MTGDYTSKLGAGLGMVEETRALLDLWQPGMDSAELERRALESARFPQVTARRLHNLVGECFGPRYLVNDAAPACLLKRVAGAFSQREFNQLLFIFTCRAHLILFDFLRQVYWASYAAGRDVLTNEEARAWVVRAVQDGKTTVAWSETMIQNNAGYLTGVCADYGLLERGHKTVRKILPYRIEPRVAAILAYDLHLSGLGDNSLLAHPDWALFGLEPPDVLAELKRLALQGLVIVQSAGAATRISWTHKSMEELIDVLAQRELR